MSQPELMITSDLPSALMAGLQKHFTVHHREHIFDPSALSRIRAIVCAEGDPVSRELMALLPRLKLISVLGPNTEGVDLSEAQRRALVVVPTSDVSSEDTADFVFGLVISLVRRIPMADQFVRQGDWVDGAYPVARRVHSLRLGLVGMNASALALARRAQSFGMSVAYTDPGAQGPSNAIRCPNTLALAQQVDVLIVLSLAAVQACGRVDALVLAALGPKGYLVNLAKGAVMDEAQVAQALQSRQLAGLATDAHPEQPRVSAALRQARNVIVTPALASATQEAAEQASLEVVQTISQFLTPPA